MIKSMTGFGKEEAVVNGKKITVEIRTLNSKQIDVSLKSPSAYKVVEVEIRLLISEQLQRGRVDVYVEVEKQENSAAHQIDTDLYKNYAEELNALSGNKLKQEVLIPVIMSFPNIFKQKADVINDSELKEVLKLVEKSIQKVNVYRLSEGKELEKVIIKNIQKIQHKIEHIEILDKKRIPEIRQKILLQLNNLDEVPNYDPARFEQELIYYIEKIDITEEKIRLTQHCRFFIDTLKEKGSAGKKLSFITQEMGREINTIGSKANHFEIQKTVVEMKDELEQIKEQLGNVL